jgi:hypothetical protein
MAGGKVHHWKHGWIPLDAYARNLSERRPPLHRADAVKRDRERKAPSVDVFTARLEEIKANRLKREAEATKTGILWKEGSFPLNPQQRRSVAKAVQDFEKRFPGLKKPITIESVTAQDMKDRGGDVAWGLTSMDPDTGFEIALNETMWDDEDLSLHMREMRGDGIDGMVAAQAGRTPAQYRRMIIDHELAHYMQLRNQQEDADKMGGLPSGLPLARIAQQVRLGQFSELAWESVTPYQMGFRTAARPDDLQQQVPRWAADSLDHKSAYAMGQNEWEWFAEALLDGMVNGDKASEASKRAVQLADRLYGGTS